MNRTTLEEMDRNELIEWLEGQRSIACYDEESTEELRETALDDFDRCGAEEGFADG